MGGCSSKPKTADFEGGIEVQGGKPQEEAPRKILEAENGGLKGIDREQGSSERSIQTLVTEQREPDDLRAMFAETEKQMIASFSLDGNFKEERQVLEDDRQHVKQVLEETINDSEAERNLSVKEEILKLQMSPEVLASQSLELHEDSSFVIEITKELQETPVPTAIEAETVDAQQKPFTLSKKTLANEEKYVFSESNSLSLQDSCISTIQGTPKIQVKPMCPQDVQLELSKDLSFEGEEILELQKEPFASDNVDPGLQKDAPKETSTGRVESENQEAVYENGEQRLDDSVGGEEHDKRFEEGTKESEELYKETEVGACEVVNAASDGVRALERGGKVLKNSSKPIWEDEIKGVASEEAAEEFITVTYTGIKSPFAEASDQEPSREIDSSDAVYPAITAEFSPNNLQHIVREQAVVQEEQEEVGFGAAASRSAENLAKLLPEPDSAPFEYKMAMKDVIPQADIHPVTDFLMKDSCVETVDTTNGEAELISGNTRINDKHLSPPTVVSEDSSHVQLLLENSVGDVEEEKAHAAIICIKEQRKSDASSTPNEVTASQVIATTKKPEAPSVHTMEFAELAFIPVQDIPAPDIDEVLEKLASEFERQERVARATP